MGAVSGFLSTCFNYAKEHPLITGLGTFSVASGISSVTSFIMGFNYRNKSSDCDCYPVPLKNVTLSAGPCSGMDLAARTKRCDDIQGSLNRTEIVFIVSIVSCVISGGAMVWRILVIRNNRQHYIDLPDPYKHPQAWQDK